jgi:hypothetical protein
MASSSTAALPPPLSRTYNFIGKSAWDDSLKGELLDVLIFNSMLTVSDLTNVMNGVPTDQIPVVSQLHEACGSPPTLPPAAPPFPPICPLAVQSTIPLPSGGATACLGAFVHTGIQQFGRPVYEHANGFFLYFWDDGSWGGWLCSSDHAQGNSFMYSSDRCTLLEAPECAASWQAWDGTQWTHAPGYMVACAQSPPPDSPSPPLDPPIPPRNPPLDPPPPPPPGYVSNTQQLDAALANVEIYTALLEPGTYSKSTTDCDSSVWCINRNLTVQGMLPGSVVLDAGNMGDRRVLHISGNVHVKLINLNISGGSLVGTKQNRPAGTHTDAHACCATECCLCGLCWQEVSCLAHTASNLAHAQPPCCYAHTAIQ